MKVVQDNGVGEVPVGNWKINCFKIAQGCTKRASLSSERIQRHFFRGHSLLEIQ